MQQSELERLFKLFQDSNTGLFNVKLFIQSLQDTKMTNDASILKEYLQIWQSEELSQDEFDLFFSTTLDNRELFEAIYKVIDKNNVKYITEYDLNSINQQHKLNFSKDQIKYIIKYLGDGTKLLQQQFLTKLEQGLN